jgi:hypothetical protein
VAGAGDGEGNLIVLPSSPEANDRSQQSRLGRYKMRLVIATLLGALVGAWFTAVPAAASGRTDVIATAKQYLDYFNQGDEAKAATLCGPQLS